MDSRLLALAITIAGGAAPAAVIIPSDPAAAWKAVADRLHSTVIEVRGRAPSSTPGPEGTEGMETITFGTGVLIGNGLAVTTLHAVAQPSASGKMIQLQDVQVLVPDLGSVDARVIAGAPDLDIAILALPEPAASVEGAPFASETPMAGESLVAMGAGDGSVSVLGVLVSSVNGDLFTLLSKRTMDSRFWGGPLFDSRGQLAGIQLTSLGPSKAISARTIQWLLDQRGLNRNSPPRH
jgi:S1-C subfamily serine protease